MENNTLSNQINNYFEIELLDTMADVQGNVNKFFKNFIYSIKQNIRGIPIKNGYQDTIEIYKRIDEIAGEQLTDTKGEKD